MKSDTMAAHGLMLVALAFLLATRYLIYGVEGAEFNVAQAIGANTAYFFIWILAYWLALTSVSRVPNSVLGFFATIISPLTMPLVGFALLIVMIAVRRSGNKRARSSPPPLRS